mmetsp:Transcript_19965/g.79608  ORF Transcript_19965/g.79608 Transcript_19965/m.79608 type:complete len:313 (+) Transcript_19965:1452-2390(+)
MPTRPETRRRPRRPEPRRRPPPRSSARPAPPWSEHGGAYDPEKLHLSRNFVYTREHAVPSTSFYARTSRPSRERCALDGPRSCHYHISTMMYTRLHCRSIPKWFRGAYCAHRHTARYLTVTAAPRSESARRRRRARSLGMRACSQNLSTSVSVTWLISSTESANSETRRSMPPRSCVSSQADSETSSHGPVVGVCRTIGGDRGALRAGPAEFSGGNLRVAPNSEEAATSGDEASRSDDDDDADEAASSEDVTEPARPSVSRAVNQGCAMACAGVRRSSGSTTMSARSRSLAASETRLQSVCGAVAPSLAHAS